MKRLILVVCVAAVLVLAFSGVALASSGHDIYNDFAAHNTFTHTYSVSDLKSCLNDAGLFQYGRRDIWEALEALIKRILSGGWPTTTTTTAHPPTTAPRCTTTTTVKHSGGHEVVTITTRPTTTTTTQAHRGSGKDQDSAAGGKWPFALIGLVAVPGLGGGGVWFSRSRRKPKA